MRTSVITALVALALVALACTGVSAGGGDPVAAARRHSDSRVEARLVEDLQADLDQRWEEGAEEAGAMVEVESVSQTAATPAKSKTSAGKAPGGTKSPSSGKSAGGDRAKKAAAKGKTPAPNGKGGKTAGKAGTGAPKSAKKAQSVKAPAGKKAAGSAPKKAQAGKGAAALSKAKATDAEKFAAFKAANRKSFASPEKELKAFENFKSNRAKVAAANAKTKSAVNPKPFTSTGPLASLSAAKFRARLNAKPPKRRTGGRGLKQKKRTQGGGKKTQPGKQPAQTKGKAKAPAQKQAAGKKARFVQLRRRQAPGGGAGGAAGKTGGTSGKTGGNSGKTGGNSSKTGGDAGKTGGNSSKTGGDAGKTGGSSSKTGGNSSQAGGNLDGLIVAPTAAAKGFANKYSGVATREMVKKYYPDVTSADYQKTVRILEEPKIVQAASFKDQPLRDQQGECGSCWAHGAIGSLETAMKQARTYRGPLSVQQVVDCVRTDESRGCAGGTPMDALDYFKTHPIALASEYPWTGVTGECKEATTKVFSKGWEQVTAMCTEGSCPNAWREEMKMLNLLAQPGAYALVAYVDATNWQNYNGGLYPTEYCSSTSLAANHIVQIVGWGEEQVVEGSSRKNVAYWLVRNSWGDDWGSPSAKNRPGKGYIKLPFGVNACGIGNYAGRARA